MKKCVITPGVDKKLLIKDAGKLLPNLSRRLFLRGATSLGALTFLTGCDIVDQDSTRKFCVTSRRSTTACRKRSSIRKSSPRSIRKA